jgi:uncharacterized coiled-coil protein SlyX
LKSTGLLITSSGNAVSAAAAVAASGVVHPWAAFGGGRASTLVSGALPSSAGAHRAETHDGAIPSYPLQLSPQASGLLHTGRTSIASRRLTTDGVTGTGASLLVSSHAAAAGQVGLDSSGSAAATLESRVTAAEAAMTLRDHIIKQLVLALQQKKAEIRSLKEQLAGVLQQLESAEGEEASSKAKLRELAEGFQVGLLLTWTIVSMMHYHRVLALCSEVYVPAQLTYGTRSSCGSTRTAPAARMVRDEDKTKLLCSVGCCCCAADACCSTTG